jgi:hypothetical protein
MFLSYGNNQLVIVPAVIFTFLVFKKHNLFGTSLVELSDKDSYHRIPVRLKQ